MKVKLFFNRNSFPRNSCQHGQRQLTRWWHADFKVVNMFYKPIEDRMDAIVFYRIVRGRRLWVYLWFTTFFVDLLFISSVKSEVVER